MLLQMLTCLSDDIFDIIIITALKSVLCTTPQTSKKLHILTQMEDSANAQCRSLSPQETLCKSSIH